jgi:hypothetical protein
MKFNIYGRFQLDVRRESESWVVYCAELGKRTRLTDVVIPPNLVALDLATYPTTTTGFGHRGFFNCSTF